MVYILIVLRGSATDILNIVFSWHESNEWTFFLVSVRFVVNLRAHSQLMLHFLLCSGKYQLHINSTSTPHQAALSPLSFAESISGWNTVEYAPLFASYDWEWQPAPDILSDIQPNFFKIKTRNESFKPGLMVIPDFSYLTISISSNK